MRCFFLLLLLVISGCVADLEEPTDSLDLVSEETEPLKPAGSYSSNSDPDPCAPIVQIIEIDGKEHIIEIPVECHPETPLDIHWGDDYSVLPEGYGDHEEQFEIDQKTNKNTDNQ